MGTRFVRWPRRVRLAPLLGLAAWMLLGPVDAAPDAPRPGDDLTFRPTVMIRKGKGLGSGTIIASREGETLVLTASHVLELEGPILVELFRFNFGVEKTRGTAGFPRIFPASIAARDADTDLAILRIRKQLSFPYIARLAPGVAPPPNGTPVTTIGFDKGEQLIGFSTRIRSVDRIDLEKGGGVRSFLVTQAPPEIGRSGGGLFKDDGTLVGVCVGRAELTKGQTYGLFTSLANIKALILAHDDLAESMVRANIRPQTPER